MKVSIIILFFLSFFNGGKKLLFGIMHKSCYVIKKILFLCILEMILFIYI